MGLYQAFITYNQMPLGNARAKVVVNGNLNWSIRQGYPLVPLLYAIAMYGLSFLVDERLNNGLI